MYILYNMSYDKISKEMLVTGVLQIDIGEITNTKNIDGLLNYKLSNNISGVCGKDGYIIPKSSKIIKRSAGKVIVQNSNSFIEYNITYKIKSILPYKDELYEGYVNNNTKMGIIAYMDKENIKQSPIVFIIPHDYMKDKSINMESLSKGDKITIRISESRMKSGASQIQVVGTIESVG